MPWKRNTKTTDHQTKEKTLKQRSIMGIWSEFFTAGPPEPEGILTGTKTAVNSRVTVVAYARKLRNTEKKHSIIAHTACSHKYKDLNRFRSVGSCSVSLLVTVLMKQSKTNTCITRST